MKLTRRGAVCLVLAVIVLGVSAGSIPSDVVSVGALMLGLIVFLAWCWATEPGNRKRRRDRAANRPDRKANDDDRH